MTKSSAAHTNKRAETRKAANGRGRIVFLDKKTFLDCTILDTSASGARIRLRLKGTVPAQCYLLNVRDRSVHAVRIAWEKGEQVGLSFKQSHALGQDLPAELAFMRKLWLELATR